MGTMRTRDISHCICATPGTGVFGRCGEEEEEVLGELAEELYAPGAASELSARVGVARSTGEGRERREGKREEVMHTRRWEPSRPAERREVERGGGVREEEEEEEEEEERPREEEEEEGSEL